MLNDVEEDDNPEIKGIMPHQIGRFFHLYRYRLDKFMRPESAAGTFCMNLLEQAH
jgi:hypothetical protein